ncbi:MAG: DUF4037 domain-containing protein [Clostridia bacterium]|nr:DUF4037 domain-containing protein [Clostridia bacterium]
MKTKIEKSLNELIEKISGIQEVSSIGISGELHPLPTAGKGDFDIFIYCDEIPKTQGREEKLKSLSSSLKDIKCDYFDSEAWGICDYCTIEGIDTWMMYFRKEDVIKNMQDILAGKYLWKTSDDYFPIGRIAMLSNINIFYDNGFLDNIKKQLAIYPEKLKEQMVAYHTEGMLDAEDFERSVSRGDIVFYHHVLEKAIEHFLMALYALNETYFPSMKRSLIYISTFATKPELCGERLLSVIKEGAHEEGLITSYDEYTKLCNELNGLCRNQKLTQ